MPEKDTINNTAGCIIAILIWIVAIVILLLIPEKTFPVILFFVGLLIFVFTKK